MRHKIKTLGNTVRTTQIVTQNLNNSKGDKTMKKLIALVLALAMVATLGLAFAANQSSITINNAVSGHTYTAYQIFAGDYSNGTLSNITWGNGISDTGKTALETAYNVTGAVAVAGAIGTTDAAARTFAEHIGENTSTGHTGSLSGTTYTISDLPDGYYMIVDTYTPSSGEENVVYSRYMVQKAGEAVVNNKADKPTVEKKIVAGEDLVEANTANIGDTVNYKITSAVPDMTGYKEYYMTFSDTLSKGLTYTAGSLIVKIGGTAVDEWTEGEKTDKEYSKTIGAYSSTTGTSITVNLFDLVSRHYAQGAAIEITYSATVNDNAVVGNTGNPNTVDLTYSNNPQDSGNGTPDDGTDGVTGITPDQVVKTYVTQLDLFKKNGSGTALEGAVFNVQGTEINKVIITGTHFVEDADGTWYLLTDNTYTEKVPTEATKSSYANLTGGELPVTVKYAKQAYGTASVTETKDVNFQVISGSDGHIVLTGLKEGTYTFTEVQAPAGYNKLASSFTVTISSNISTDGVTAGAVAFDWSATGSGVTVSEESNGTFSFDVLNQSGTELPSTGGIGTTIFYILGGLLVIGAAVILVARRKASN
jgi:fimbrial isopeptide formation D2 family protein/LPXTG-motif cell wall-anchored protein